jgi:hypothetical protein
MSGRGSTRLTLRPGSPGTRRHTDEYGEKLVAVRYRYDRQRLRRYTTVELIVDDVLWIPQGMDPGQEVPLRIRFEETVLRERLRAAGARWDPATKSWWLTLSTVARLELTDRIVPVPLGLNP